MAEAGFYDGGSTTADRDSCIRLPEFTKSTNAHKLTTATYFLLHGFPATAVLLFVRSQHQTGRRRKPWYRFPNERRKLRRLLHPKTPLSSSALPPNVATSCVPPRDSSPAAYGRKKMLAGWPSRHATIYTEVRWPQTFLADG